MLWQQQQTIKKKRERGPAIKNDLQEFLQNAVTYLCTYKDKGSQENGDVTCVKHWGN